MTKKNSEIKEKFGKVESKLHIFCTDQWKPYSIISKCANYNLPIEMQMFGELFFRFQMRRVQLQGRQR